MIDFTDSTVVQYEDAMMDQNCVSRKARKRGYESLVLEDGRYDEKRIGGRP